MFTWIHLHKMKKTIFLITLLLTSKISFANNELCPQYPLPEIITTINYGTPNYISTPKQNIIKITGLKNPLNTMGLTIANFSIGYSINFSTNKINDGYCINISKINFEIGYKDLKVLIDDKYEKDTCEYDAIKKHEKTHVKIYQNELKYYAKLIIEELKYLLETNHSFYINIIKNEKELRKNIDIMINNNENIKLLKQRLLKTIITKNQKYDSKEEYIKVKESCNDW